MVTRTQNWSLQFYQLSRQINLVPALSLMLVVRKLLVLKLSGKQAHSTRIGDRIFMGLRNQVPPTLPQQRCTKYTYLEDT